MSAPLDPMVRPVMPLLARYGSTERVTYMTSRTLMAVVFFLSP